MVHSLVQQLVRQDPAQYALYVALRPDHHIELISYPCCTKYASPRALLVDTSDTGLEQMIKTGQEENMIQGSVAMDNEDEDNCSSIAVGFHQH